jgi:signal transduction histidine kinase
LDDKRLRQVLLNLLGNAVKFTERGEVRLSVANQGNTATRARLRFSVRDTGIGIAGGDLATIFIPSTSSTIPSPAPKARAWASPSANAWCA